MFYNNDRFQAFFYSGLIIGLMAMFSALISKFGTDIATVWMANSVLAFLLLRSREKNLLFWIVGGALGIFLVNIFYVENTLSNSIAYTLANCIDALIIYYGLKNYIGKDFDDEFDISKILIIIAVASLVSGVVASILLKLPDRTVFDILFHWMMAKTTGALTVLPILLLSTRRNIQEFLTFKDIVYTFMAILVLIVVNDYSLKLLQTPLLIIVTTLTIGIVYSRPFSAAILGFVSISYVLYLYKTLSSPDLLDLVPALNVAGYAKYFPTLMMSLMTFILVMQKSIIVTRHNYLKYTADRDWLTGLFNRRYFEEIIENNMQQVHRNQEKKHVLLMLDLDRFKIVNDTVGHQAGDRLLKEIGELISQQIRSTDIVARLGGDEFAILMRECTMNSAVMVAQKIINIVNNYRFKYQHRTFSVGVSIGLANMTCDIATAKEVMERADYACYESKRRGRGTYVVFKEDAESLKHRRTEIDMVNRIKYALENNAFELYAHRIVAINPEKEDYFEILLRMKMPDGTLISACEFLPVAERYNLIIDIDRWVFSNLAKNYDRYVLPKYRYSINVSGISLSNQAFVEHLYSLMLSPNVDMTRVQIEITESTMITDVQLVKQFIAMVKAAGSSVVLDDFGAGYSSFHYVVDLDVHSIKVDSSFIKQIDNPASYEIVKGIVDLSKKLNIRSVAEYVDTDQRFSQIKDLGFDYAQGFWQYEPIPLDRIADDFISLNNK